MEALKHTIESDVASCRLNVAEINRREVSEKVTC